VKKPSITPEEQLEKMVEAARIMIRLKEEFESWSPEKQEYVRKHLSLSVKKKLRQTGKIMVQYCDMLDKAILENIEAERVANAKTWSH
jgi:hypothetical protein